jgi:glucose-6-phosphate 1-dehydrogenase
MKSFKQFLNEFEIEGEHQPTEINPGVQAMLDIESEYYLDIQSSIEGYATNEKDAERYIDMMINEIDEYKGNMDLTDEQAEEFEENLYLMKKYYKEVFQYCMR